MNPAPTDASSTRSPLLQPSLLDGVLERERNRGGRGVAVLLEIDDDGALVEAEAVGGGLDDAAVGLVRHEEAHVLRLHAVLVEHAARDLLGLADGELEHGGAVLLHVVQALLDGLARGRPEAAAGGHLQGRAAAAVDLVREAQDVRLVVGRRRQHHRAGAVAEQHAGGAVLVVDDARHDVGADDERVVVRAARDHLQADRQREGEARAGRAQVEAPRVHRADLVLQQAGGAREHHVGRRGADDDEADVGRGEPGLRDGLRARPPARGRTSPPPGPRRAARGCRCAAGSTRWRCRPASRGRRWSAAGAARRWPARRS